METIAGAPFAARMTFAANRLSRKRSQDGLILIEYDVVVVAVYKKKYELNTQLNILNKTNSYLDMVPPCGGIFQRFHHR